MKYFTITGTWYCYGPEVFEKGQSVRLIKEPDNPYDHEAIRVEIPGLGKVGYVANSTHTVLGNSLSAGRLYDRIGDKAKGKVEFVTDRGILCSVKKKKKEKKEHEKQKDV